MLRIVRKLPAPGVWEFEERFVIVQVLAEVFKKNMLDSFFNLFQSFDSKAADKDVLDAFLGEIIRLVKGLTEQTSVTD